MVAPQVVPEAPLLPAVLVLLVLLQRVLPPQVGWLEDGEEVCAMLEEDEEGGKGGQKESRRDEESANDVSPRLEGCRICIRSPLPVVDGDAKELREHIVNEYSCQSNKLI